MHPQEQEFLQSIRQSPEDKNQRLIYADWLEEHADPLGEFIRLQTQAEEIDDLFAPEHSQIRHRIDELLQTNQTRWLKTCSDINAEHFRVQFRYGMVERVYIGSQDYPNYAAAIKESFPALEELVLFEVNENADHLSGLDLSHIPKVRICDWISTENVAALAASLEHVEELSIWARHPNHDGELGSELARWLPQLKKLRLVRFDSEAFSSPTSVEPGAWESVQAQIDSAAGRGICEFELLCTRKFPLDGEIGCGSFAGTFSDGRPGLVTLRPRGVFVIRFDDDGCYEQTYFHPFAELELSWHELDELRWDELDEVRTIVSNNYGFQLGRIHVREFCCPDSSIVVQLFVSLLLPGRKESGAYFQSKFIDGEHFCFGFGAIFEADQRGKLLDPTVVLRKDSSYF